MRIAVKDKWYTLGERTEMRIFFETGTVKRGKIDQIEFSTLTKAAAFSITKVEKKGGILSGTIRSINPMKFKLLAYGVKRKIN